MKRFVVFCLALLTGCSLVGCGDTVEVNVDKYEELSSPKLASFIEISDDLSYDEATRIVYIENYTGYGWALTAYYAPNGLPYRYNVETNTLEQIEWSISDGYHQNDSCS